MAWTLALLVWLGEILSGAAPLCARRLRQRGQFSLAALSLRVRKLLLLAAFERAPPRRRGRPRLWRHGRSLLRPGMTRAVIGSRLRRALRRTSAAETIAVLIDALRNPGRYAALIATRRKLTRRWPRLTTPQPAAPLVAQTLRAAPLADTS